MVTVPGFLLSRLYVKQSLKNTPDGFEFQLKNTLGSGYAHGMQPLTVDDAELSPESTFLHLEDGTPMAFNEVSKEKTLRLGMNKTITIQAKGVAVDPGPHKIGMGFDVPGLGTLRFDFTDTVKNE